MPIQNDVVTSDIQLKVMNYNSTAVTRTLSNLLPVGTAAEQREGTALSTNGDIDATVRPYTTDEAYQNTLRTQFYSTTDYVGIAGALRARFAYLMKQTAPIVVSSTYQNKGEKTSFGGE